jgi:hypothetical protein
MQAETDVPAQDLERCRAMFAHETLHTCRVEELAGPGYA